MLSNNKQLSVGSDLFRFREFKHLSSRSRRNCQTALNVSAAPFQSSSSAWHSNEVPQLANIVLIQRQRSLRTTPHHYIGNHNNGRTHPGPAEQSAYNIQTIIVTCPTRLVSQLRTAQAGTSEDNTYQAQTRTHFSPLKRHVSSQTSLSRTIKTQSLSHGIRTKHTDQLFARGRQRRALERTNVYRSS